MFIFKNLGFCVIFEGKRLDVYARVSAITFFFRFDFLIEKKLRAHLTSIFFYLTSDDCEMGRMHHLSRIFDWPAGGKVGP